MLKMLAVLTVGALLSGQTAQPPSAAGPGSIVSTAWLQQHLADPDVRVIATGDRESYDRAHIPGARLLDHMATVGDGHRLLAPAALAEAFSKAGAKDGVRIVLYGDEPMATGWMFMALASIGHAGDVSLLDGNLALWTSEKRTTSSAAPVPGAGPLTVRPAPDVSVDAAWVRSKLESPAIRLLDVRTMDEWNNGHLPGATLILWQDLYADRLTGTFNPSTTSARFSRAPVWVRARRSSPTARSACAQASCIGRRGLSESQLASTSARTATGNGIRRTRSSARDRT